MGILSGETCQSEWSGWVHSRNVQTGLPNLAFEHLAPEGFVLNMSRSIVLASAER
jgi:hypothetical protein